MKLLKRSFAILLPLFILVVSSCTDDQKITYLALGDSYTIGESVEVAERWPVQLSEALRDSGVAVAEPQIIAETGWTTTELSEAIEDTSLNPSYDLVSLLIGVNDQYDGLDFATYPRRFTNLLDKAIELAGGNPSHVLVVSIPDYSVTPFGQQKNPDRISQELEQYNATNRAISDSLGVHYVDITPGSQKAAQDSSLIAGDGLHPSGTMYTNWVNQIMPVLLPEIKSW